MGRHTRVGRPDDEGPPEEAEPPSGRPRFKVSMIPVPLLPIVALVLAVGVVSYAMSTQQISLNFAGEGPRKPQTGAARENQVSQRGPGDRADRGTERADGLVVAFRMVDKAPGRFRFTATVANRGQRPVPKWALAFKIPGARIVSADGATVVRTGKVGYVRSRTGAPALTPGQSIQVGFVAKGEAGGPSVCKMNGHPCDRV